MQTVEKNVADIPAEDRPAVERLLGRPLVDNQRLVIAIAEGAPQTNGAAVEKAAVASPEDAEPSLPDWVGVFADIPDEEMAELEALILDRSASREFEI